jgi:hypothetical protein
VLRLDRRFLAVLVVPLVLVATSPLRVVGDGADYVGAALNLAGGRGLAMSAGDAAALHARFEQFGAPLDSWDVEAGTLRNRRGQREFGHFWFYSLLAAPWVLAVEAVRLSPLAGFTLLNLLLYAAAWRALASRASWQVQVLLLAGPIVWWLDKAHTEVFTFTLLTVAGALLRARPELAAIAAAAASTQNPPLAVLALGAGAIAVARAPRRRSLVAALAAAAALAALHPAYYLLRFGTLSPLVEFSTRRLPTTAEIGVVVWDPVMGIAANWPLFTLAAVVALGGVIFARRGNIDAAEGVVLLATLAAVLVTVAQTQNPVHGGTPGISRYALWLGPLLLPVLLDADSRRTRGWTAALTLIALVSAAASVIAFHPARAELSHRPTPVARWLWSHHPSWNDPIPPVFSRSLDPYSTLLPVATADCRKILLIGREADEGMWPMPCLPVPVPERCRERGALCYANARASGYAFTPIDRRWWRDYSYAPQRAWPRRAEAVVAQALAEAGWWRRRPIASAHDSSFVRDVAGTTVVAWIESGEGAAIVVRRTAAGAVIHARRDGARWSVVSGATGERIASGFASVDGAIALPPVPETLVVTLLPR